MTDAELGPLFMMARADDPPASKAAAVRAQEFRGRHHRLILEALASYGPRGATAEEIEGLCLAAEELDSVQVTRRIWELRKGGKVVTFNGKNDIGCRVPEFREHGFHVHCLSEHQAACKLIRERERNQQQAAERMTA